ncbi:MAG TPA: UDP-N-acetylglucosamine 1-carboxyvinyltransferase [Candidatus Bipolaricaulota bacterium]|nr:UDP-N-acetylglucosamine 1-carboxyvinyltransferase [Candidatus Bipolaricaulota bacterium]
MSKFIISGGYKLNGEIKVNGAKNAALKAIAASLLTSEEVIIENCPEIEEISRLLELVQSIGTKVKKNGTTIRLQTKKIESYRLDPELVKKIRVSVLLVGPMLIRLGKVRLAHPGGCAIGQRPVDLFIDNFKKLGASLEEGKDYYQFTTKKRLKGAKIVLPKISVTVTEEMIITAVLAVGTTVIKNAACEPEIEALAEFLNSCGAKICGAGTPTVTIEGVECLSGGRYKVIPDRVEAGSFAILGALVGGKVTVTNCLPEHLESLWVLFDKMGVKYEIGPDYVTVWGCEDPKAVNVQTHEYPGFATDIQPPFTVLLTQAKGMSLVHETVFEGRLFYTDLLNQMGANIIMCDPYRVIVNGPVRLFGRKLASPDLRAGFALILAALVAHGKTEIDNIYQIDRGYSKVEQRLRKLGAKITRTKD